ncbi:TPA: hypothetical protein HA278_03370, partial [Candidatus Woesearchaeota archaeon]|nr:hypothetical protein [Candidatus Woesearchaeota archaeon]
MKSTTKKIIAVGLATVAVGSIAVAADNSNKIVKDPTDLEQTKLQFEPNQESLDYDKEEQLY